MRFKRVLVSGLLLLALPVAGQAGDYTYTTNNGKITITGYIGSGGAVTITNKINGLPVTSIGPYAFNRCTNLTSVTIPSSITSIRYQAFNSCTSLTSIAIPSSVTSIDDRAFFSCTSLTSITVNAINSIYSSTNGVLFNKTQTELIQYPTGKVGSYLIPDSVTSIGISAFQSCASLTSITIPDSVTSIGISAFQSCASLTSITIPDSVTSIGSQAFVVCTSLTNAVIGNNVTNIGSQAFNSCASLTNITIPGSVTSIGDAAFVNCTSLTSITVDATNSSYSSTNGVLFNKKQTVLIEYPGGKMGNYLIPSGVKSIGQRAFSSRLGLTSITIPDSVTSIGYQAFNSCTSLTGIYFLGNAPSVDSTAFDNDNNATVYRLSGTSDWPTVPTAWAGCPTALWYPISVLTINGGTGSGSYSYQQQVPIAAAAPAIGKAFDRWTGDTQYVANATYSNATVTMPARDMVLIATYQDAYCTLTVASAHGTPVPSIGSNSYVWGSCVTCSVSASVELGIDWRATGWTGTGAVPVSGSTDTTEPIVLTNASSSITWNWSTVFSITNIVATQRPGTKLVDITYDIISDVTNAVPVTFTVKNGTTNVVSTNATGDVGAAVLPGTGRAMVWDMSTDWNTNSAVLTYSVLHATATNFSAAVTALSDSRDYTLSVSSAHGIPVPGIGTTLYAWASSVPCSVPSSVEQGVNWHAEGWLGTGSIPTSGITNTIGTVILTNVSSSITWNWETAFAITNVTAVQRPGTKLMDITYDIISDVTEPVPVSLIVQNGGLAVAATSLTGSIGSAVPPGTGQLVVWNAGADWNGNVANLSFTVKHSAFAFAASSSAAVNTRDYTLTVQGGSGGGIFNYQQQVGIAAILPSDWFRFVRWEGPTQYAGSATAPATTVIIPATNITLTAIFTNLYTINANNTVTLTGYNGAGGVVFLPETLEGRPVTGIANLAFYQNSAITHVTVPATVTNIGIRAFSECPNLEGIYFLGNSPSLGANAFKDSPQVTVYYYPGSTNWTATYGGRHAVMLPYLYTMQNEEVTITQYTGSEASVVIPSIINGLPVTGIGDWSFYGLENLTGVTIPSSVTWIGEWAFGDCINLSGIIIPDSVTNISDGAFSGCGSLQQITFRGGVPDISGSPFANSPATVFYRPGLSGWEETFGGRPAKVWNPVIQSTGSAFGMRASGFNFAVSGDNGTPVIVESVTNLTGGVWMAIATNFINDGVLNFSDPQATNTPEKFYRLRMP
ncbi:MAG: leucine-rich repeat protein [Kiritimatiellales bacterium]